MTRPLALMMAFVAAAGCASPSRPDAPVAPAPPAIDELVAASWRTAGLTPAPAADDGALLRRMTLDLAGRVPTLAEARAYLADRSPDKRARAADRLLTSHEFAEHWGGDVYAGLLFGNEAKGKAAQIERRYDPAAWLVQAFAENRPYDRIAVELLTATGDVRENAAVAFVAARLGGGAGPEAVAGAAARLFLGLQIQCAQCHDHPYDVRWKQEDFYGLVAYFARTRSRREKLEMAPAMAMDPSDADASMSPPGKAKRDKSYVVLDVPRGEAKMRRPGSEDEVRVEPRFLGRALTARPGESRRMTLARAIVGSELFAKAMVARTSAQLLGHGIVDPFDDLGAEDDPRHPPLLRTLAERFAATGHDVRALVRTIVLSTAYDRAPAGGAGGQGNELVRLYGRSGVRPLPPDSLFRSLVVATGADGMALGGRRRDPEPEDCATTEAGPMRRPGRAAAGDPPCTTDRRLRQAFRDYEFIFGDDEMAEADRFDGSVPQSLLLWNGELTNRGSRAENGGVLARILADHTDPAARLDELFLAAYTRRPRADERARLLTYLREQPDGRAAYEDLFFALLTSTEAITNH